MGTSRSKEAGFGPSIVLDRDLRRRQLGLDLFGEEVMGPLLRSSRCTGAFDFEVAKSRDGVGGVGAAVRAVLDHAKPDVFAVLSTTCHAPAPKRKIVGRQTLEPAGEGFTGCSDANNNVEKRLREGVWMTPRLITKLFREDRRRRRIAGGLIENVPQLLDDDPDSPWAAIVAALQRADPCENSIGVGSHSGSADARALWPADDPRRSRGPVFSTGHGYHALVLWKLEMADVGIPNKRTRCIVAFWQAARGEEPEVHYVPERKVQGRE